MLPCDPPLAITSCGTVCDIFAWHPSTKCSPVIPPPAITEAAALYVIYLPGMYLLDQIMQECGSWLN